MKIEQKNRVLASIHRVDEQNVLPGTCTVAGQTYSYYFLFDKSGITVMRLVLGSADLVDQWDTIPWRETREFQIKNGLLTNQLTFWYQDRKYCYMLSKSVVGNPWVKENRKHLESVNYYYSKEPSMSDDDESGVKAQLVQDSKIDESDNLDYVSCLTNMRISYQENPLTGKKLHKPLWLRQNDGLIHIFEDQDLLYTFGEIYYGCLVQANSLLLKKTDHNDYPATFIYSTDPYFAQHPEDLREIAETLYDAKDTPAETLTSPLREIADILNAETDRSQIDFSVTVGETKHIVRLCSTLVFRKDLPDGFLRGSIFPMIALPERSDAVMILPKEYWGEDFIEAKKQNF